ncbi:MAG: DUF4340 domain-containing protein [Phycisphaera sp.]|nr:DUF4340 domain-containing protein [Phycisphaera sp.]
MSETKKTAVFGAIGLAMLIIGIVIQPRSVATKTNDDIGQPLFADFTDPLTANSLEVLAFEDTTGDLLQFKVAKVDGAWVIPSHENYPADASRRMADAASSLIGLQKLGAVSDSMNERSEFGVRNPEKAKVGDTGVGRLVRMTDDKGNTLVQLIVGDAVKDRPGLRYVRVPGQDRVYVTKVDPSKLTTKFDDWIERDFLKLNAADVRTVTFDNHSIDEANRRFVPGDKVVVHYDPSADPKWSVKDAPVDKVADAKKLDAMRNALDDLKIIDVTRKPDVLVANLRKGAEMFSNLNTPENRTIIESLIGKGFFPASIEGQQGTRILSNQGQIIVTMKDGVEYVLRFGEIAESEQHASAVAQDDATKPSAAEANRYIYVLARLNEDVIEKPKLEPEATPTPEGPPAPQGSSVPKPSVPPLLKPNGDSGAQGPTGATGDAAAATGDAAAPKPTAAPAGSAKDPVHAENDRKMKEYKDKVDGARKRVDELNNRFADWYYVISDEVYRQIKLSRQDVLTDKKAEAESKPEAAKPGS